MRLFLHLGYDGTMYHGWQWQPKVKSVQKTIENCLERIFKRKITVYGCGRTDAGVHASQYMCHINLEEDFNFDLKFRLNKNLPPDIALHDILEMESNQHSRYDAKKRTYDYFIHLYKDSTLNRYSSFYEFPEFELDFDSMQKAASIIPNYLDFRSLCKQPDTNKHTNCQIVKSHLFVNKAKTRMRYTITADRFLHNMIRYIIYFLLEIGTRKLTVEEFEIILADKSEFVFKKPALPNGLFLSKIEYDYLQIDEKEDFCSFLKTGLE